MIKEDGVLIPPVIEGMRSGLDESQMNCFVICHVCKHTLSSY